ncbi:transposase [Beijerinckia indica]|uniref:transposase n=1 Tax=Beijerinckia indica TaxID=533 RepID=UPI0011D11F78|nr:transposase [Beijerinckia indica]
MPALKRALPQYKGSLVCEGENGPLASRLKERQWGGVPPDCLETTTYRDFQETWRQSARRMGLDRVIAVRVGRPRSCAGRASAASRSAPSVRSCRHRADGSGLIERTKGGLNSKLHVVCDETGRPRRMVLTEGQMSDHKGAGLLIETLPSAKTLIGDRGYDSNWFGQALEAKGILPAFLQREDAATL